MKTYSIIILMLIAPSLTFTLQSCRNAKQAKEASNFLKKVRKPKPSPHINSPKKLRVPGILESASNSARRKYQRDRFMEQMQKTCPKCKGSGKTGFFKSKCKTCGGDGKVFRVK